VWEIFVQQAALRYYPFINTRKSSTRRFLSQLIRAYSRACVNSDPQNWRRFILVSGGHRRARFLSCLPLTRVTRSNDFSIDQRRATSDERGARSNGGEGAAAGRKERAGSGGPLLDTRDSSPNATVLINRGVSRVGLAACSKVVSTRERTEKSHGA